MTATTVGQGIALGEMPTVETPEPGPVEMPSVATPGAGLDMDRIKAELRAEIRGEMDAYVADAERRLAQAREIEQSVFSGIARESVHTEDINVNFHMIDGYNLTANSPAQGSIAWSNLHVVLAGVDYTINPGNTANKYVWFVKPASYIPGTDTVTLTTGPNLPTLGPNDALIFINNVVAGSSVPISVLESSIVYAVGPGAIGNAQLDPSTQTLLTNLQNADTQLQQQLDGAINSYYQANPPWPDGAPSPSGGNVNQGDVWYDSDNGWTYRWTGSTGTPANTWFRIADTDIALVQAKVNTKITTYLAANGSPPTAPSGGFTTGDLWMVTDQGNKLKRWTGSAWADVLIGDGAIASGISGAKIGTGINGDNITTGTVAGTRVGPGVAGAVLTSATGTISNTQLAVNAVQPKNLNVPVHMLY